MQIAPTIRFLLISNAKYVVAGTSPGFGLVSDCLKKSIYEEKSPFYWKMAHGE